MANDADVARELRVAKTEDWADEWAIFDGTKRIAEGFISERAATVSKERIAAALAKVRLECCKVMCPRCESGEVVHRQPKDDYISNFGTVEAGNWTHPWTNEHDLSICPASPIHEAALEAQVKRG
jgi:hypothetical protein